MAASSPDVASFEVEGGAGAVPLVSDGRETGQSNLRPRSLLVVALIGTACALLWYGRGGKLLSVAGSNEHGSAVKHTPTNIGSEIAPTWTAKSPKENSLSLAGWDSVSDNVAKFLQMCHARLDVLFVLDGSNSIISDDWQSLLHFVQALLGKFEIGDDATRAGVIQFSRDAYIHCPLSGNRDELLSCAAGVQQMKLTTHISKGLQSAYDELKRNPRPKTDGQLVFLIADGLPSDVKDIPRSQGIVKQIAPEGSQSGRVFSVAVGTEFDENVLKSLASREKYFFHADDFHNLASFVQPILFASCEGYQAEEEEDQDLDEDWAKMFATAGSKTEVYKCGNDCLTSAYFGRPANPSIGDKGTEGFYPLAERWISIAALGNRIRHLTDKLVLASFVKNARQVVKTVVMESNSNAGGKATAVTQDLLTTFDDWDFVSKKLSPLLRSAALAVDIHECYTLVAEFQGMEKWGLTQSLAAGGTELDKLRHSLVKRMLSFRQKAKMAEHSIPLLKKIAALWTGYQDAWGTVRIYAKITTGCKLDVPADYRGAEADYFANREAQQAWEQCNDADSFVEEEYPAAAVACARIDDSLHPDKADTVMDRDNMVRMLGCGASRITREPLVHRGPATLCEQVEDTQPWYNVLCSYASASSGADSKCGMFGPFYSVFSGKINGIFGQKNLQETPLCGTDSGLTVEKQCHLGVRGIEISSGRNAMERIFCGDAQVEGFKTMINSNPAQYIYGDVPPLPVSKAEEWKLRATHSPKTWTGWEDGGKEWPLPENRDRDPPLGEVLREVKSGSMIVLMAYGYSGAGKTTTLIGDNGKQIDGVVSVFLKTYSRYISDVYMSAAEIYGRMSALDGTFVDGVGQGIWAYKIREGIGTTEVKFLGDWTNFHRWASIDWGSVGLDKLQSLMDDVNNEFKVSLRDVMFHGAERPFYNWEKDIQRVLSEIENIRREQKHFDFNKDGRSMAHIRGTPNNPSSSRGTLYIILDIEFRDGAKGSIAVVDLAGSEDPAVMASGFMGFMERPEPLDTAWTTEIWTQRHFATRYCNGMGSSLQLIRRYLHRLNDHRWMDGYLAECAMFRKMLLKCPDAESDRPSDCAKVSVRGTEMWLRPNLDAPPNDFIAKSKRFPGQAFKKPLTFPSLGSFTPEEVLRAMTSNNAGEGKLDSVMFERLGAVGWNTKNSYQTSHSQPDKGALKLCDDGEPSDGYTEYFSNGRIIPESNKVRGMTQQYCPIARCVQIPIAKLGDKVRRPNADLQLERHDKDVQSGERTFINWRANRCNAGKKEVCTEENMPPQPNPKKEREFKDGSKKRKTNIRARPKKKPTSRYTGRPSTRLKKTSSASKKTYSGRVCKWPERLWHRVPYLWEKTNFNTRKGSSKYDRMFDAAANGKDSYNIGGDMLGQINPETGAVVKKTAYFSYDQFLSRAVENFALKQEQLDQRLRARERFWMAVQAWLDEYKEHDEQLRWEWDLHVAYFTQVVGPMVEESLYINEMLNQMRNYLKAVSHWGDNPAKDPWKNGENPHLGTPLSETLRIDAEAGPPAYYGYEKIKFVKEKDAEKSYFEELAEGKDRLLGISYLELIRRKSMHGKYRNLFGSFVRTDKPSGDPDCSGAHQSLAFSQLLIEEMGRNRLNYIGKYLPKKRRLIANHTGVSSW